MPWTSAAASPPTSATHIRRADPLLHIDVKPGQAPPGRGLARPQPQPSRPELSIEWRLVRAAINVGSHITDGEAKRFTTTMLLKAQRLSTESVPSMSLTKVLATSSVT